jgi:hypothetical protein
VHTFASVWLQTIDMSPFTECSELRFFLFQVLETQMERQILAHYAKAKRKVLTALSLLWESTVFTCDATMKPGAASMLIPVSSSKAVSANEAESSSPCVPVRSQGQSKRS